MENTIFVLSKQEQIIIERLHVLTWNLELKLDYTEYGLEINRDSLKDFELQISLPNLSRKEDVYCLSKNICENSSNCRFIFNSDIPNFSPINGNAAFGTNVKLIDREFTVLPLPANFEVNDGILKLHYEDIPSQAKQTIYLRFVVKSNRTPFANSKKGIAKKTMNFDVRINEMRMISKSIIELQKKNYMIVKINKCFYFHIIPNSYMIEYVDNNKLQSIRNLESSEFQNYLGEFANQEKINLKPDTYNIVFCKQNNKENYSFFTSFSKERLGNEQISLAIGANLLCSLLFAIGGLHQKISCSSLSFWQRIPVEYWVASGILIILLVAFVINRFKK